MIGLLLHGTVGFKYMFAKVAQLTASCEIGAQNRYVWKNAVGVFGGSKNMFLFVQ